MRIVVSLLVALTLAGPPAAAAAPTHAPTAFEAVAEDRSPDGFFKGLMCIVFKSRC